MTCPTRRVCPSCRSRAPRSRDPRDNGPTSTSGGRTPRRHHGRSSALVTGACFAAWSQRDVVLCRRRRMTVQSILELLASGMTLGEFWPTTRTWCVRTSATARKGAEDREDEHGPHRPGPQVVVASPWIESAANQCPHQGSSPVQTGYAKRLTARPARRRSVSTRTQRVTAGTIPRRPATSRWRSA